MSTTPRTNDKWREAKKKKCPHKAFDVMHVYAAELETELQQANAQIAALRGICERISPDDHTFNSIGAKVMRQVLSSPAPPVVSLDDFLSFMRTLPLVNHRSSWDNHIEAFAAKYTTNQDKEGA